MKRITLLTAVIILTFIFTFTATGQTTLSYRPMSQFNGDITAYLKYNFDDRSNQYQGKTFGDLMKDMEINPLDYFCTWMSPNLDNNSYVTGINIVFKHTKLNGKYSVTDAQLYIGWENPFLLSLFKDLDKQYPCEKWVSQHYDFFKDKKIKIVRYGN